MAHRQVAPPPKSMRRPTHRAYRLALFITLLLGCFAALMLALSLPSPSLARQASNDEKIQNPKSKIQNTNAASPSDALISVSPQPATHSPQRAGGPDAYGYVFADEIEPGGPTYTWRPASNRIPDDAWRAIPNPQLDSVDDGVVTTTLPFQFNYYGANYTTMHISTNGNVHFGPPNDDWPSLSNNQCVPSAHTRVPLGMIAPLWLDFVVPDDGPAGVYTSVIGSAPERTFIVEWREVHEFRLLDNLATFELLLSENGDITFQYQSLTSPGTRGAGGVVGIQNVNGTVGLPYSCYEVSLINQRAIRYYVRPDVILTPNAAQRGGAPGATVTYSQTLFNQTGMDNSFTITPGGNVWTTTVQPPETGTIPRGGQIPVTVSVQIPPDALIGAQDVATITVSSELPTRGAFTATAVLTSSVSSYGVDFNPQGTTRAGRYGAPVTYTVQLINRSGITNTFDLSHRDSEWPTSITPTQTGSVGPDASVPITITVSVPANGTLGMRDTVVVTAEGQQPEPGQFFGVMVITTTAGLWERKANMPVPRSRGAAVTLPSNGRIYLVGGENNNGNTNLPIEEYDPIGNRWTRRASLSIGVSNVGAAAIGDAIYVPGGYSGPAGRAQTALQVYYPLENRVDVVASDPLPQPRLGSGVTAHNGKFYVIGGSDDTLVGTNTVYQYDPSRPAGSRWQQMAPMPTRRLYLAAATVDSLIYAVGGLTGQLTDLTTLEVFDPASNTWATRRPMSVPRAGLAAVGVSSGEPGCGGYLYAIGGGWSDYTADAERYDMTRDVWEPVSGLSLARRSLAAAYSPSTRALVAFGGWTGRYESIAEAVQCSGGFTPPTPVPTPTCTVSFSDVPARHTFYAFVRCLACLGIVSGYADGTFKPDNLVTRGQLAKIVSNAAAFADNPDPQIYQDVPSTNPFYQWINRLSRRGYMGGYTCGGPGEPCVGNRPYFRPFANATRAQTSKIVSNAARYSDLPTGQTFEDVPSSHPFYVEIQRLASRGIMGGYECGGPGEPCVSGKPYFRPYNDVTRGQSAKIVANTFYTDCQAR